VPGSDWLLVAQVDEAELLAAARGEGVSTMVVILLLMLLAGAVVSLVLINRQRAVIGRMYRAERARSILASRYDRLLAQARDIFLLVDDAGRVVDANDAATSAYGYSRAQLLAMSVSDLRDPASRSDFDRQWNEASSVAGVLFETVHRRRDGSTFPVEVSSRAIELEGRLYRQSLVRDITERRDSAAELQRLATAYATLAATNALIVHAEDEPSLLSGVCATLVESGGYLGAWVGTPDEAVARVMPVATAGALDDHIRAVEVRLDGPPHAGQHPAAAAWRENRPCYREDIGSSTATEPWLPEAAAHGIAAVGSLPLHGAGGPRAVLTLYSRERHAFAPESRILLEQMADDISFALGSFDQMAIRRRTEESLVTKEAELASQVDELRRWYEVMLGREERALELKEEVNQLLVASGRDPRYGRGPGPDTSVPG
jgi:PAS domain S-box-containing protein